MQVRTDLTRQPPGTRRTSQAVAVSSMSEPVDCAVSPLGVAATATASAPRPEPRVAAISPASQPSRATSAPTVKSAPQLPASAPARPSLPPGAASSQWRVDDGGHLEIRDGNVWRHVHPRVELERLQSLSTRFAQPSRGLNPLNRSLLGAIGAEAAELAKSLGPASVLDGWSAAQASRLVSLRDWFVFAVTNQNYCSPSTPRADTASQLGPLQLSPNVKYQRSEVNTNVFGEEYNRNVTLIRANAGDAFAELAARYVAHAPEKRLTRYSSNAALGLRDFLQLSDHARQMVLFDVGHGNATAAVGQVVEALQGPFDNAVYLRCAGALPADQKERLQTAVAQSRMQLILDEDYDPMQAGESGMRKITFLHDQADRLRYQLVQDASSMGFRPSLDDAVRYRLHAGHLEEAFATTASSATDVLRNRTAAAVHAGADTAERDRDYRVLQQTVQACQERLDALRAPAGLESSALDGARAEARAVSAALQRTLNAADAPVAEVAEVYHSSLASLRTLVGYAARLGEVLAPQPVSSMEEQMARAEGGRVIAANSGMSAARTVTSVLAERVGQVVTTPHYWETDFLLENMCSRNPHYADGSAPPRNSFQMVAAESSAAEIDAMVDAVVAHNPTQRGGQLLCMDRSISPFFYTHTFDLARVARRLDEKSAQLKNPVYLVVDNTLDFPQVNAARLFPNGVPRNVFLVFTPSQAKLHQLGLDLTTAGMVNLHFHPSQAAEGAAIEDAFRQRLAQEGSLQTSYALRLLDQTFYQHHRHATMSDYLHCMVDKRERNAAALIENVAHSMPSVMVQTAPGVHQYRDAKTGSKTVGFIDVRDPSDAERAHPCEVTLHYNPQSPIHAYLKIVEAPTERYVAPRVFDEFKRRLFAQAAEQGILLADGTSWGFPTTRLDHYMHTLRIAVGQEHQTTMRALGDIFAHVLRSLVEHPDEFLKGTDVRPLNPARVRAQSAQMLALDRLIPHDPAHATPIEFYENACKGDYSFALERGDQIVSMLVASRQDGHVYLSKAATAAESQGQGCFHRLFEQLRIRARQDGETEIALQTSASRRNLGVVRAYEKCGFTVKGLKAHIGADGWPLVLVDMRAPVDGASSAPGAASSAPGAAFDALPDGLYEDVKRSGSLQSVQEFARQHGWTFKNRENVAQQRSESTASIC